MEWWSQYIGVPFGEGVGQLTCWGLVRRVYAECLRVDLPEYGEISARDLARIARTMEGAKDDGWVTPDRPDKFDVALMRSGRGGQRTVHVGVMVDDRRMIHVEEAAATALVPITHFSVAGRILGFRRLA